MNLPSLSHGCAYEFKWDKKTVKPKFRVYLFKHIFFVLFFCLLLHGIVVLLMIFYKYYCTDLGLQLGELDLAPLDGLSLWTCWYFIFYNSMPALVTCLLGFKPQQVVGSLWQRHPGYQKLFMRARSVCGRHRNIKPHAKKKKLWYPGWQRHISTTQAEVKDKLEPSWALHPSSNESFSFVFDFPFVWVSARVKL